MTLRNVLAAACLLLPLMASAHNIENGQRVPAVGITDRGELILDNDKFSYKAWNSAQLPGKVRVVQHLAGRSSAKEKNASMIEAIKSANLPHDRYQTPRLLTPMMRFRVPACLCVAVLRAIKNSTLGHRLLSTAMA